jgi:Heparinase II/III-like protein
VLSRYNAVVIEEALRAEPGAPPFPPADDRAAWDAIRETSLGEADVRAALDRAETAARTPLGPLPASLYLEFVRSGDRAGYEQPARGRREALWSLALGECLDAEGRFAEAILDVAWAMCEESSWAWPAHQLLAGLELADPETRVIDLAAAMTALELAELDWLLGSRLHPALGRRIRAEVERRCLEPYLTRHDHHWLHGWGIPHHALNNWTAVCNAGVAGAALYLEPDPARLAEILARATRSLDDYLATFDPDGGSAEGPGYWSYGFSYYTALAHLVEQRTGGRICPLDGERVRQIAQFPLRTLLSPGAFANFSDCDRHVSLVAPHLAFLGRRLDLPGLSLLARRQARPRERSLTWGLRSLVWRPPGQVDGGWVAARHDWFSGQHWMIARLDPTDPDALVLAAKGGHNGEPHNQNDLGTFIVHTRGESVVADPGRGRYTRFYFGPERYDHLVNSSLGHSVPVPNGQVQRAGREHAARLLEHQADERHDGLVLDLSAAYPAEAGLAELRRSVSLERGVPSGRVEVVDHARFAAGPGSLESVLITFGQVELTPSSVLLRGERGGLRVSFDAAAVTPRVEVVEQVDLAAGPADVRRVVFALAAPAAEATIRLTIEPV